jgi:hypothetical protein
MAGFVPMRNLNGIYRMLLEPEPVTQAGHPIALHKEDNNGIYNVSIVTFSLV